MQIVSSIAASMSAAAGTAKRVGVESNLGEGGRSVTDIALPCQGRCEGQGKAWWSRPLSLSSAVLSSAGNNDVDGDGDNDADDDKEESSTEGGGNVEGGAVEEMDFVAALALTRAFAATQPGSKTSCGDEDLKVLRAAFWLCVEMGITTKSNALYGSILTFNRMMDREMAVHLGYFTKYADLLAEHVELKPELASKHSRRFEDFCDDFGDAIGMATGEEKAAHERGARAALRKLIVTCEGAGIM